MTFQSNVPQASDKLTKSQQDLLGNFQAIGSLIPVNHIDFGASGAGKHKFVEMPNQGSNPAGAANEFTIFSKLASSVSQLFYKRDNEATAYQLTGRNPTGTTNGTTFLPGGFILIWGRNAAVVNNTATNFHTAFPNNCFFFAPILNSATDEVPISVKTLTASQFTIKFTAPGNIPILY